MEEDFEDGWWMDPELQPSVEDDPDDPGSMAAQLRRAELMSLLSNEPLPGGGTSEYPSMFHPPEELPPKPPVVPQPKPQGTQPGPQPRPQPPRPSGGTQPAPRPAEPLPASPPAPRARSGVSEGLINWVIKKEGFSEKAFSDYGQMNIGHGTSANGRTSITRAEARAEAIAELEKHMAVINQMNPNLPQGVKDALASLSFNTGGSWYQKGSRNPDGTLNLRGLIETGDLAGARQRFIQYNKAGGTVLGGLMNRRNEEANMFVDPKYITSGKGNTAVQDWGGKEDPSGEGQAKPPLPAETKTSFLDAARRIVQNQKGSTRNLPINEQLTNILARASAATGLTPVIYSGGQPAFGPHRTGSHRHDYGGAGDLKLRDESGRILNMNNPADQKRMAEFITHAVRAGATGVGAAPGYMGPESIHIGGGSPATWGAKGAGSGAPQWLRDAYAAGQSGQVAGGTSPPTSTQPEAQPAAQPSVVTHIQRIVNEAPQAPAPQPMPDQALPPSWLQTIAGLSPQAATQMAMGPGLSSQNFLPAQGLDLAGKPTPPSVASQPKEEPPETIDLLRKLAEGLGKQADKSGQVNVEPNEADLLRHLGSMLREHLGDQYGIPDLTSPSSWTWDTGQKLINAGMDALRGAKHGVQGVGAGAGQFILGTVPAVAGQLLSAGYALTKWEPLYKGAKWYEDLQEPIAKFSRGAVGLDEADRGSASQIGETIGRIAPGGWALRAVNAAGEFLGPPVLEYINEHWEPHFPTLEDFAPITPAQAQALTQAGVKVETDEKGNLVAVTPGGNLTLDQHMVRSKGILGILGFGVGLGTPAAIRAATRAAKKNNVLFEKFYGDRSIPGLPNSKGMMWSTLGDFAKANMGSTVDPMVAMYDRAYQSLVRTTQLGSNAVTAAEVSRNLKIYDHTGKQNLISAALEDGKMQTPTLRWESKTTIPDLIQYEKHYPVFDEYIRLKVYEEQLQDAHNARLGPMTPARLAELDRTKPLSHTGTDPNVRTDMQTTRARLQYIEQTTPDIHLAAEGYKEIVRENRRFNSEGTHRLENPQDSMAVHLGHDYTPWYNLESSTRNDLWHEARAADTNMVHMLERETSKSMNKRMDNEWQRAYLQGLPAGTMFREVDPTTLKGTSIPPDFLYKSRHDGVTHTYAGDSLPVTIMKLDPYGFKDVASRAIGVTKVVFTKGTTGPFAPPFAFTALGRAYLQHLVTADKGLPPVGPLGLAIEAINQKGLKVTAPLKPVIDAAGQWIMNTPLGKIVSPQVAKAVSRVLTFETTRLFNEQFKQAGGKDRQWHIVDDHSRVMVSQQKALRQMQAQAQTPQQQGIVRYLMRTITTPMSLMWRGDKHFRNAVHNATRPTVPGQMIEGLVGERAPRGPGSEAWGGYKSFVRGIADLTQSAYARKHGPRETFTGRQKPGTIDPVTGQPITMADLVAVTRDLTGNPANKGHGLWQDSQGNIRSLAFHAGTPTPGDNFLRRLKNATRSTTADAIRFGGKATDLGHTAIPWSGTLIRSPAKTIAAMATNPYRAVPFMIATQMIPAMLIWRYNQSVSPDHADYGMNRRSAYDNNNTIYIAREGHPPQQGWTIPNFQEANPFFRGIQLGLDQLYGNSPHTFSEDFDAWVKGVAETNLKPPWPSPFAGFTAAQGGVDYGEGLQARPTHPFKQYNKDPNMVENITRALMGSVGDYMLAYYNAAHAAEGGLLDEFTSGVSDTAKLMTKRAPFFRDILGYKPQVPGNTRIGNEIHEYSKVIDELSKYYTFNVLYPDSIKTDPNFRLAKQADRAAEFTGDRQTGTALPPGELANPGLAQPGPVPSAAYHAAMIEMENLFKKDDPTGDLAGYKVLFNMYGKYTAAINNLRNVVSGNENLWLKRESLRDKEEARIMTEKGINVKDHDEVLGYYLDQRNKLSEQILQYIKAAETKIDSLPEVRKALGEDKHFTIKDAAPYSDRFEPGWKWKGADPLKGLPENHPLRTPEGQAKQKAEYQALQERLNAEQAQKDIETAKARAEQRKERAKAKAAGLKADSAEAAVKAAQIKAQADQHKTKAEETRVQADQHKGRIEEEKLNQLKLKLQQELQKTGALQRMQQLGQPGQLPFNPFQ